MYGSVRDLILAERQQGIDAQFIDYLPRTPDQQEHSRVNLHDGEIVTVSPDWANNADILVRHSLVPEIISRLGIPMIMCLHGRPEYCMLMEYFGRTPIMEIITKGAANPRYKAFVTFWEEHLSTWQTLIPEREIHYVPAPVDLDTFNQKGDKFNFGDKCGNPNIVIADLWREDVTPYDLIFAALHFRNTQCPDARIHIFGFPPEQMPPMKELKRRLGNTEGIGIVKNIVNNIGDVYRSADILITPHNIATRVIRESLASGLPVVAGSGNKYTEFTADTKNCKAFAHQINRCWTALNANRKAKIQCRDVAEKEFNYKNTGEAMLKVFNSVLNAPKSKEINSIAWNGWTLDPTDWVVLRDVLIDRKVQSVFEFGSGTSTVLFDRMKLKVTSYETDKHWKMRMDKRTTNNVNICLWGGRQLINIEDHYDIALIDGPFGGENRERSYESIAKSDIPLVACHDMHRDADKKWVDKYFKNWKRVAINHESVQGLLILERPNSD